MADRELLVRILGDDRDLQQTFTRTERRTKQFESRFTKLNQSLRGGLAGSGVGARGSLLFGSGAFIGTAAVTAALSKSVDEASALNEEISKSRQIFGQAAAGVEEWSQTTAAAMGISQRSALEATGVFGNLFNVVGIAPQKAAELSQSLVQLAADLASFNNADPTEVLTALRSGLIGEAEPLRRFGVLLSETRVQQIALANTGKDNVKALTDQEKALARYQIILRDTAPAQGDFVRTSEGLANQSRIAKANLSDLSATLGKALIPTLLFGTQAANDFFLALKKLGDTDFTPGFDLPDPLGDFIERHGGNQGSFVLSPPLALFGAIRDAITKQDQEIEQTAQRLRSPDAIDAAIDAAEKRETEANRAKNEMARSLKAFDSFVKGMGLKLSKAELTTGLSDDIAALRELEQAILRRIEREGKTFKLVEQLTQTRLAINALVQRRAGDAKQAGEDAFNATVDALNLDLEIARATKSFADDEAALRALEQAILRRIQTEGETTDLLRQLFSVRQEQADVARQIAEQARTRRQERQFGALGLTDEGDEPTPGVGALSRRTRNLRDQIKGTVLDTAKTRQELDRIQKVLSGKFGAVGKNVREAILKMLNDISSALEGQGSKKGPLTKTSGLNTKKILEGLGLSAEQENELRGRLSSINTAGRQLPPLVKPAGSGARITERGFGNIPIFVESTTTINLDGQQVAKVVTRQQQKTRRRNPQQKRGPNRR